MKITERLLPPQETRKQQLLKKNNLQANRTRRIRLQLPKTKEPQVPKLQQKRLRKIQTLNQLQDARKVRTLRKRNAAPMPKRKQPKLVLSLTHKLKQRRSVWGKNKKQESRKKNKSNANNLCSWDWSKCCWNKTRISSLFVSSCLVTNTSTSLIHSTYLTQMEREDYLPSTLKRDLQSTT